MTETFESLRPRLFGVAYAILGSVADAEDVLQDAWIAWSSADRAPVREPEAYLIRLVSNRSLNALRSRQRRREAYLGPWLPEPLATADGPAEAAAVADSLTFALMVLLEQLSPLERAAFVLREVFAVPTEEVGRSLDRSPEAVRQLVSRARAHLRGGSRRYDVDPAAQRSAGRRFVAAMRTGDIAGVLAVTAPDVVLFTDGGGEVQAARRPVVGVENVLRFFSGLSARYGEWHPRETEVNGLPGIVVETGGTVSIIQWGMVDGVVTDIWVVRNPRKLGGLGVIPGFG